ncbi:MAG: TonB-dependent receptor [Flavihumibacter sp.]
MVPGDFNLSGTLGNEIVSDYSNFLTTTGRSITIPGFVNLKNFTSFTTSDGYSQTRLFGVFADFSADYKQIINLNVKARNDFSSTLPKGSRSIFYPAVAVSFVATEAFPSLKESFLDYLKIRANIGEVGKGASAYATNTYYVTASAGDGFGSTGVSFPFNGLAGYSYSNTAGNENIRPEFTREIELGTEAYFFNRRLSVDLSVYKRESRDLIFSVPVPVSSGYSSTVKNAGRLSTKGIEFLISGTPIKQKNFNWDVTLNFTSFKTMVTQLADGVDMISLGGFTSPNIQAVAGHQYGLIYSNMYVRDAQGRMIIKENGLPQVTSAVGEVGNPNPKLTTGLTNAFRYKNWNFSFLFDLKYKGDMLSRTIGDLRINGAAKETAEYDRFNADGTVSTPYVFEGVTEDGKENTTYVTAQQYWGLSGKYVAWEGYVLDATYLKLREATLSYAFNKQALSKIKFLSRLEIAVYGRNLLTYAPNYPHLDPEQNLLGISNARGLEFGYQPTARTVGLSVKASF